MSSKLNSAKKRKPTADDFLALTSAQLRDLANDLDYLLLTGAHDLGGAPMSIMISP